ncbi:MAG: LIC12162 family protein [Desulfovibrionaceae bacterium]
MRSLVIGPLCELLPGSGDQEHVLLGPWCLCRNGHSPLDYRGHSCLPSPWGTLTALKEANRYVLDVTSRLVESVARLANDLHGVNHSTRFWQLVLNGWPQEWLNLLLDIHTRLESTCSIGPLHARILPPTPIAFANYSHYARLFTNHHVWAVVISDLLRHSRAFDWISIKETLPMEPGLLEREMKTDSTPQVSPTLRPWLRRLHRHLAARTRCFFGHVYGIFPQHEVYLMTMADPMALFRRPVHNSRMRPEISLPEGATLDFEPKNSFEELIPALFPLHVPRKLYQYEEHAFRQKRIALGYHHYRAFDNEYYYAHMCEQGGKWISVQHGCSYGMDRFPEPNYEYGLLADEFITWGWGSPEDTPPCHPLPSPHLTYRRTAAPGDGSGILFMTTKLDSTYTHRLDRREYLIEHLPEALGKRKLFLQELGDSLRREVVFRPYASTSPQYDELTPLKDAFPDLKIVSSAEEGFIQALDRSRLIVCDAPGTGLLMAMAMGVPCMAYIDPDRYAFTEAFRRTFDKLLAVEIVHTDPLSAARCIRRNHTAIGEWWNEPERQRILDECCIQWARSDRTWYKQWRNFLWHRLKALDKASHRG